VKIESRWFLVPFVGFLAANANASPSMCLDGENTIFNCELKGAVASLCISRTNDLLAYGKGTPGKLELVLDEKRFWNRDCISSKQCSICRRVRIAYQVFKRQRHIPLIR
jgi:hypothetical protein